MSSIDYAWLRYADLQQSSKKAPKCDDYAWGIESALNYLLNAIETGTIPSVPADLDAAVSRAIASGARLRRSRSLALKTWVAPFQPVSTSTAAEANLLFAKIASTLKKPDTNLLLDAGIGYTDQEIADRRASTPGAIRVRLSRLRRKLMGIGLSTGRPAARRTTFDSVYPVDHQQAA